MHALLEYVLIKIPSLSDHLLLTLAFWGTTTIRSPFLHLLKTVQSPNVSQSSFQGFFSVFYKSVNAVTEQEHSCPGTYRHVSPIRAVFPPCSDNLRLALFNPSGTKSWKIAAAWWMQLVESRFLQTRVTRHLKKEKRGGWRNLMDSLKGEVGSPGAFRMRRTEPVHQIREKYPPNSLVTSINCCRWVEIPLLTKPPASGEELSQASSITHSWSLLSEKRLLLNVNSIPPEVRALPLLHIPR